MCENHVVVVVVVEVRARRNHPTTPHSTFDRCNEDETKDDAKVEHVVQHESCRRMHTWKDGRPNHTTNGGTKPSTNLGNVDARCKRIDGTNDKPTSFSCVVNVEGRGREHHVDRMHLRLSRDNERRRAGPCPFRDRSISEATTRETRCECESVANDTSATCLHHVRRSTDTRARVGFLLEWCACDANRCWIPPWPATGFGVFANGTKLGCVADRWAHTCALLCAGQVVCGIAIAGSASALLYQFMKMSGIVLGALMVVIGLLGVVGSAIKHRPMLNLYLVGALFGVMLTFQYIGELGREVTVDCALAELDVRTINLSTAMKKSKDKELFASIYSRMDEMEQMMSMVHAGAVESLAIKSPDDKLRMTDAKYIRKKLDMLHRIASEIESDPIPYEVIAHVVKQARGENKEGEDADANQEGEAEERREVLRLSDRQKYVKLLSKDDKQFIEDRLKAAEKVLDFIDDHDDGEGDVELTTDSYRELLEILTGAFDHPKLEKKSEDILDDLDLSVKELPNMHGAIQRAKSDSYGKDKVEKYIEEMHELEKLRAEKKKKWTQEFRQKLMHSNRQRAKLNYGIDDMPQHCIEDEKALSIITKAGYALVSFLLLCAFIVLNLLFHIPQKGD